MENTPPRPGSLERAMPLRRLTRTPTAGPGIFPEMDSEVVPLSLAAIAPILRVANEIEEDHPRVAYLCRFYAFDQAHEKDPSSLGRGVRQFKTALLHKLERDDEPTRSQRKESSDEKEMRKYYEDFHLKYLKSLEESNSANMDRALLAKTYQTAAVLFDVLKRINLSELDPELIQQAADVNAKQGQFTVYNILPLDQPSTSDVITRFPEIQAVITALQNVRGLPRQHDSESNQKKDTDYDIFDWLQSTFGFQADNVANQREHLILLLANTHVRQVPRPEPLNKLTDAALDDVTDKLFKNYKKWCRFLHRVDNMRLPNIQLDIQQRKILYIGLYLLIWGEAANLRFMPECLCYIFHQMAGELHNTLAGNVSIVTGESVKPSYHGNSLDADSFLQKVITPIYELIKGEFSSADSKHSDHSAWRNYDDLNEYFWSIDCFSLSWPIISDKKKFFEKNIQKSVKRGQEKGIGSEASMWMGKTNFVEARSFWHIFRSFNRIWSFLILSLQAMIIIAWNGSGSISLIFDGSVFKKVLSIFITFSFLRLIQAIVDIGLSFKAWQNIKYFDVLRYVLKVMVALAWVIALPVCYAHSWGDSNGLVSILENWFGKSQSPSLYVTAVLVYMIPDAVSALLFLFPMLRRAIERSELTIVKLLLWWAQPQIYVGRGMHESLYVLFKYTLFWVLVLTCKLLFSYYLEIKPLIEPTKQIMAVAANSGPFPNEEHNFGVILLLWTPVVLVYFMDTQIWYAIWSTIFGGINGAFSRLGEIRTLEMLKSRFQSLPGAFNANLVSRASDDKAHAYRQYFSLLKHYKSLDRSYSNLQHHKVETSVNEESHPQEAKDNSGVADVEIQVAMFSQLWNAVINSLWKEDYISNSEMELLLIPYPFNQRMRYIQWPPFLLANKVASVVDMVEGYSNKEKLDNEEIFRRIKRDPYMEYAVTECYDLLMDVLCGIIIGKQERSIIEQVAKDVNESIKGRTFFRVFRVTGLVSLFRKIVELVKLLEKFEASRAEQLTFLLQDILEVYDGDVRSEIEHDMDQGRSNRSNEFSTEAHLRDVEEPSESVNRKWEKRKHRFEFQKGAILYPPTEDEVQKKIKRLHLLLATEESFVDVPSNLEARRRITFFVNSLFMEMPPPPRIQDVLSLSILTPYYGEDILFTEKVLKLENDDGISVLYYLKKIYPDEWKHFLKRADIKETDLGKLVENSEEINKEVCEWASYHAQTLTRTVRGMMYYREALEIQAFFDLAERADILKGYTAIMKTNSDDKRVIQLREKIQAIVDMKFTYVVSCQEDEFHKRTGESRANDIVGLLKNYPCLRVAYVEEVEVNKEKIYYSVLVKHGNESDSHQIIYKIKLPGQPILGEGKAENQNHAIIFTRGDALQAIDMNQDFYLEEALKMRNFLQEFYVHNGIATPSILGMREHIFSGSVSSLAGFMSRQESTFVTLGQRVLANPLRVRFHYGHSDVFDRLFHLSRGGISKASPTVNLSENIFAGYNTVLRNGCITHHEYIQVGKGRDMRLNQICMAEARIATGNGEQTMSRDIYRLGHRVDFFRMCSVYHTTIGPYVNSLIAVLVVYVFLYGRLYLSLSGLESNIKLKSVTLQENESLQVAMASQALMQVGFLISLPMLMEIGLEEGFRTALSEFVIMQLQLAAVFFTFMLGIKMHFYGRTLLHGGPKYNKSNKPVQLKRSFVVFHAKFAENYRLYSRSHFIKAFELLILLIIYYAYGSSSTTSAPYVFITFLLWFLVGTWLFAPALFNPSGFEWQKVVDDWEDWSKWVNNRGGIGVPADKSWETWWEAEQEHLERSGFRGRVIEILLAGRFLIYQYGLVYHLNIAQNSHGIGVYIFSWFVVLLVLAVFKAFSWASTKLSSHPLVFRVIKGMFFFLVFVILAVLFGVAKLTFVDLFISALAFLPSGWALIQIAQSCKGAVKKIHMWDSVKSLARGYESVMGLLLFAPVAILAWFPFISDFQTRLLFNQAFSRGLQISRILAGRKDKKVD